MIKTRHHPIRVPAFPLRLVTWAARRSRRPTRTMLRLLSTSLPASTQAVATEAMDRPSSTSRRYPGDINKLLANGLANANAVLRLPAYDIDYFGGGSGFNPERDRISINGRTLPTEYLTGDNNVWKLNAAEAAGRGDATAKAGAINAYKNELAAQNGKASWRPWRLVSNRSVDDGWIMPPHSRVLGWGSVLCTYAYV